MGFKKEDAVWYECKVDSKKIGMEPNALEKAIRDSMAPVGRNRTMG